MDVPLLPTIFEPAPSTPGEVFFRAPFGGSQTITIEDGSGDILAGDFTGEVELKLNELGIPVGEWSGKLAIDPLSSTGRFAGAAGTLEIAAVNPPFDPTALEFPFDWTISGDIVFGTTLAAGGAIANEYGGTLNIYSSSFVDNSVKGLVMGVGGAITQDIGPTLELDESGAPAPGNGTDSATANIHFSSFHNNRAEALFNDPANAGSLAPFAGWGFGGAILSVASQLNVSHSEFVGNEAYGGIGVARDGTPSVGNGGNALGGAINTYDFSPFDAVGVPGRDSDLNIQYSKFIDNAAYAGAGVDSGTGGHAYGGAVGVSIAFFPEAGELSHNLFVNNTAVGGEGGADGGIGGVGAGGALSISGGAEVDVDYSWFKRNTALGGTGGLAGDGGEGLGGAIGVNGLVTSVPTPFETFTASVDVNRSYFSHNRALGGRGGDQGGSGGAGRGGAIGVSEGTGAAVSHSIIKRNRALGGEGGSDGGDGGAGQGGGVYNGDNSTTTLAHDIILANMAVGGAGNSGGIDGLGQGGGVFNSAEGVVSVDFWTHYFTKFNHASDDGDNLFGV